MPTYKSMGKCSARCFTFNVYTTFNNIYECYTSLTAIQLSSLNLQWLFCSNMASNTRKGSFEMTCQTIQVWPYCGGDRTYRSQSMLCAHLSSKRQRNHSIAPRSLVQNCSPEIIDSDLPTQNFGTLDPDKAESSTDTPENEIEIPLHWSEQACSPLTA